MKGRFLVAKIITHVVCHIASMLTEWTVRAPSQQVIPQNVSDVGADLRGSGRSCHLDVLSPKPFSDDEVRFRVRQLTSLVSLVNR